MGRRIMDTDIESMARIEREREARFEKACERNCWIASFAMMPPEGATLFLEKFGEEPVSAGDADDALAAALKFAGEEFGSKAKTIRDDEVIPNTRAPHHVRFRIKVDASKRAAELAA